MTYVDIQNISNDDADTASDVVGFGFSLCEWPRFYDKISTLGNLTFMYTWNLRDRRLLYDYLVSIVTNWNHYVALSEQDEKKGQVLEHILTCLFPSRPPVPMDMDSIRERGEQCFLNLTESHVPILTTIQEWHTCIHSGDINSNKDEWVQWRDRESKLEWELKAKLECRNGNWYLDNIFVNTSWIRWDHARIYPLSCYIRYVQLFEMYKNEFDTKSNTIDRLFVPMYPHGNNIEDHRLRGKHQPHITLFKHTISLCETFNKLLKSILTPTNTTSDLDRCLTLFCHHFVFDPPYE
jgi:hypothetical protein